MSRRPLIGTLAVGLVAQVAFAAPARKSLAEPQVRTAERFAVTRRVSELPVRPDGAPAIQRGELEIPNRPLRRVVPGVRPDVERIGETAAPVLGAVQFDGLGSAADVPFFGGRFLPPDTNIDVGPTQIVETVNSVVRIYDKSGSPLTATFLMSDLFADLGGICSTNDNGDPVVLYDPLADRWLLSQFAFKSTGAEKNVTHECIAVSQTGDATGAYWAYDFFGPNTDVFGDYPHLGVWGDGYYMTTNQFSAATSAWRGGGVFAFERARMLAGDPAAQVVYFDLFGVDPNIGGMLPADFDGLVPPPAGAPNVFSYFIATEYGDPQDGLRLYDFTVDWAAPNSSTFVQRSESPISVASFSPIAPGRAAILQPADTLTCSHALDAITDRLMHRLAYRNLGDGHELLVANHTVNANGVTSCSTSGSTFQAGVRLYELRRSTGSANSFSVANQVTLAPDSTSRWMGSAAADHLGNVGVGYSAASSAVFPGVRYTGRAPGDAANTLQSEATMVAGSGIQTSTSHRWGDYSALTIDPADDCTFWYAQEYYTSASQATSSAGWLTRIGNFGFAGCTASPRGTLAVTVTDCTTHDPIAGALVEAEGGYARVTNGSGLATFSPIAPGSYSVAASLGSDETASNANVTAGVTTPLALCLGESLDGIFSDDFETGDYCRWSADNVGTPSCSS
jgi:hypothetical protein